MAEARVGLGRIGDVVEHLPALGVGAAEERLVEAPAAFGVEPRQPAAHRHLPLVLHGDDVIDELGRARLGRAARSLVLRDDHVGERDDRGEFGRGEELRLVGLAGGGGAAAGGLRLLADGLGLALGEGERGHGRRGAEDLEDAASLEIAHQMFPFFRSSAMCSDVRHASAMIVHVRFLLACETNGPPSQTNTFFASCAWQFRLSAEVFGSLPMRVAPASWMMRPPTARP